MPQYLAPGVYVEEVPSGIKPIGGVSTSTAGFVGLVADDVTMPAQPGRTVTQGGQQVAARYPLAAPLEPQLVTSWEGFKTRFGDLQAGNLVLAHAVYGFFNNGGSRCWVNRVAPATSGTTATTATTLAAAGGAPDAPPGSAPNDPAAAAPASAGAATATLDAAAAGAVPTGIDAVGAAMVTSALDAFKAIDEIAIVVVPGAVSDAVQNAVLDHCENEHLQDRFAVLDGRRAAAPIAADVQGGTRDSSYGAMYHPWITVFDPVSGASLDMPPSGHVAGVFARVDAERGVHKAPANEVIRGALDVSQALSREDQAGLNPEDINVIRRFGPNVTIYGARTLKGKEDPEWRYVNVRRLFLFLRDSINAGVQWTVFEPNDMALWGKLRRNLSAFLTNVWRSGALFGATPQEAFYVRCDETNNPVEVRALGQVVVEIGVAVVNPAEFVIFRISQWAGPPAA